MQKNKTPEKNKKIFWLVAALLLCGLYVLYNAVNSGLLAKPAEVSYTEFLQQVDNGEIKEIYIDTSKGTVRFENESTKKYCETDYPYTETFIESMLLKDIKVEHKRDNSGRSMLVMNGVSIALMAFLVIRLVGQFKTPKKSPEATEEAKIKFSDIAGMDEIKEDMKALVDMVKNEEYKKRGAKIPKGILLQGPPGNGKTLMAKALAGECDMHFMAINASDIDSPFVGVGSNKIDKIFKEAKEKAPCVIFIDEIDSIGSRRTSSESAAAREYNTILMTLLNQMDGFNPTDNVLVLAATNRAEELDPALLRPGRFDRKFTIGYPDKSARKELFELYTKDLAVDPDISIDEFVRQTYGCSCAEIRNIINEAIIHSVNAGRENITNEDISAALVRSSINGLVRKNSKWEGKTKDIVAYHEAGHAIVAHFFAKRNITSINITPTTADAGGFTITENEDDKITEMEDYRKQIAVLYGGRAAEHILSGDINKISFGASGDIKEATKIAAAYANFKDGVDYSAFGESGTKVIAEKTKDVLAAVYEEAYAVVQQHWQETVAVAEALKMKENMTGKEFREILADCSAPDNEIEPSEVL